VPASVCSTPSSACYCGRVSCNRCWLSSRTCILQRLPHDAGVRQPGPFIAVDLAGSKRARQPPSSDPNSPAARLTLTRSVTVAYSRRACPLEISAPGRGALGRHARHGSPDTPTDAVNQMQDQRERWHHDMPTMLCAATTAAASAAHYEIIGKVPCRPCHPNRHIHGSGVDNGG
jgi:hypothetical protein